MTLVRFEPTRELQDFQDTIGRFFSGLNPKRFGDLEEAFSNWSPQVDISETDSEMRFEFELPGFEKDQVEISINNGVLTVSGERKLEDENGKNWRRVERLYGRFLRSFRIPTSVNPEGINATLKNGVLLLQLPKREEARPRQIPVQVH